MNKPRMALRVVVFTAIVPVAGLRSPVLQADDSIRPLVDQLARPYLKHEIVDGMTIGVLHGGGEEYAGYGRTGNSEADGTPDADTIYEIGSVTKVFTGLLFADAVTQKRVLLEQPAGELLPAGVSMPDFDGKPITLLDLATHSSGLPTIPDNFAPADENNPYATYSADDLYEFLSSYKLTRAPGERYEYSNLGMGLLGQLLTEQSGETYDQLLNERIAGPLGLKDTTVKLTSEQQSRAATPHQDFGQPTNAWDFLSLVGAGGVHSTARDLLKLARADLDPPENEIGAAIRLAWRVHRQSDAPDEPSLGLGWHRGPGPETGWHNGQTGGYHAMLLIDRRLNAAVVVLTNTATMQVDRLAIDVMKSLAGEEVEPRRFEQQVKVPEEVMQRYVGTYEIAPGVDFQVAIDNGRLMVKLADQPALQVYAKSETEWRYRVVRATIVFKVDDSGECSALELHQNGIVQTATRVE
jgi:CubicO group peptidase (beta-lactamase class C family)